MILAYAFMFIIAMTVIKSIILRRDCFLEIGERRYKGGWFLLAAVFVVFVVQFKWVVFSPVTSVLRIVFLNLSHIGFIIVFLVNRHLPGARWAVAGVVLNLIVMLLNGGLMPVTPENIQDIIPSWTVQTGVRPPASKNIVLTRGETRLWFLSDCIRVDIPGRCSAIALGDVVILVGMIRFFLLPGSLSLHLRGFPGLR